MIIRSNVQQGVPKAKSIKLHAGRSASNDATKEQHLPLDNKYERERFHEGFYSKIKDGVAVVEPKVMEPYEPIPGRVPRKVAIDRKRKEYASFNIEHLLKDEVKQSLSLKSSKYWFLRVSTSMLLLDQRVGSNLNFLMIKLMMTTPTKNGLRKEDRKMVR